MAGGTCMHAVCQPGAIALIRGRYYKLTQIYEGTNQVQRIVMAKSLLGR